MDAENALRWQSERHPDGWGLAYYEREAPTVIKSVQPAIADSRFAALANDVASTTVLAHVRKATVGKVSNLNSHPFSHGPWVFAHNGTIPKFNEVREALLARIRPELRSCIQGDTDSEVVFYVFLEELLQLGGLGDNFSFDQIGGALSKALVAVRRSCDEQTGERSALTVLATNGRAMVAFRNGRDLHFSTYKMKCEDRDRCGRFSPSCEGPPVGEVNRFLVSSETFGCNDSWTAIEDGVAVGVDADMRLWSRRF